MLRTRSPFPLARAALVAALTAALGLGAPVRAEDGGHGRGGPAIPIPPIGATTSGSGSHDGHGGGGGNGGAPNLSGIVSPFPAPVPHHGGGDDGFDGGGPGPSSLGQAVQGASRRGRDAADDVDGDLRSGRGRDGGDDNSGPGNARDLLERQSAASAVAALTKARTDQAQALIRSHPDLIEPDNLGRPVVKRQILAVAPSPAALAGAEKMGFRVRETDTLEGLGVTSVVLDAPRNISAIEALRRIRAFDPKGEYDFNHIYQQGGTIGAKAVLTASATAATPTAPVRGLRIGLVDGGVAAAQPTLAGAQIIQKGFAPGAPKASPHGTAVASLIAGHKGAFRGPAAGAALFVADVYGATPAGGSAEAIARALGWLAQSGAPVINISLVGPPNLLLEAAVKALIARGHIVVAAVGNDGPAAAPLYPASYPGVVAVTAVDPRWRLLPEAGRASHIDFAAPGSEMAAAGLDGRFVSVRGTSFAAPLAAGMLARLIEQPDRGAAERAIKLLGRRALDMGPPGPDRLYGRGIVAVEYRTPPGEVKAVASLRGP